jgi:predicted secreted protein
MHVGIEANGRSVDLAVGETLDLVLPENRGAGYQWVISSSGHPTVTVEDASYTAESGAHGRPGAHSWIVRGIEPGVGHLQLDSRRPWEGDRPPSRSFSIVLRVAEKKSRTKLPRKAQESDKD